MPIPSYLLDQREREIQQALNNLHSLPSLTRKDISNEDACPICLLPLGSILEEHEAFEGKQEGCSDLISDGIGSRSIETTGVVKLSGCGHIFCRKDLAEWIESHHGSCPTCRRIFFVFMSIDEAEYESSDGGEYIPDEDEDYDVYTDDGEFDLVASSDIDYDMDAMTSDEDLNAEGYVPFAQARSFTDEPAHSVGRRSALRASEAHSVSDFRVYVPRDENYGTEEEENEDSLGELNEAAALSFGSDSPSEGVSFNTEDNSAVFVTDVGVVSDGYHAGEGNFDLGSDIDQPERKSNASHEPCSSTAASDTKH